MPRVRARIAAGISVASWKSAVLRAWLGRILSWFSRCVSCAVLIGRPGWPPGKSQGDGARGTDDRVALAVRGDDAGQFGDGFGQLDGGIAEVEAYFLSADLNVLGGQPVDCRRPLGIEEEKQPGEAVFGLAGVVMQEPTGDVPAMFVIEWLGGAVPADGGDVDGGELVGAGPTTCSATAWQ
ncbi:hypothetical protein [Streptomyces malaysiensis]|uniref:Uncharacterized protein n=1 Tax=Streptomyces malaysiensis subsp. samsunensis TaxID=459658 RepID=A0A9X2RZF6_STRMQ|nr:hypothetical protein [Streptomyces samsunensis]MCQ8836128.1 hypothetical protein [Streptomyces samsunensis]